jgi:hypothetical protein
VNPYDAALELCEGAAFLLARNPTSTAHRRGAAFVGRQALEAAARAALGTAEVQGMTWRSRFLVLRALSEAAEAALGYSLWARWSQLCHHATYDLLPGAAEISHRIAESRTWIAALPPPYQRAI